MREIEQGGLTIADQMLVITGRNSQVRARYQISELAQHVDDIYLLSGVGDLYLQLLTSDPTAQEIWEKAPDDTVGKRLIKYIKENRERSGAKVIEYLLQILIQTQKPLRFINPAA